MSRRSMCIRSLTAAGLVIAALSAGPVVAAEIRAPDSVDTDAQLTIGIDGAPSGSRLELWGPVGEGDASAMLESLPFTGNDVQMHFQQKPGTYELRLIDSSGNATARSTIDIVGTAIGLSAPARVSAGASMNIVTKGTLQADDRLVLNELKSGTWVAAQPVNASGTTVMVAPEDPGTYRLSYVDVQGTTKVATNVTVDAGNDLLRSPISVSASQSFDVEWHGSIGTPKDVLLVAEATGVEVARHKLSSGDGTLASLKLTAPKTPGRYRIQVVNADDTVPLTDLPLKVDP